MSQPVATAGPRMRILCLLNDGPDAGARLWIEALSQASQVEVVDLSKKDLSYAELLDRIFAADRVLSW